MTAYRRAVARTLRSRFQPLPLVEVFKALIGRRTRKAPPPLNADWERDEPMTGLS